MLLCKVTSMLTLSASKDIRNFFKVSPATEKTLSDGADEAGIERKIFASFERRLLYRSQFSATSLVCKHFLVE